MNRQKIRAESRPSHVGQRIRMLREQRNLSQRELARLSDLSPNTLSLIEREKTSPTASTLQKLAGGLNVSLSVFFETSQAAGHIVHTRTSQRARLAFSRGFAEDLGSGGELALVTPLLVCMEPGAGSGEPMTHSGMEFTYCLRGQILYDIEDQIFLLEPGDSLLFDAGYPHRWQNAGGEPAEALLMLCMSEEGADAIIQRMG